jgi:hypothetical protein
VGSDENISNQSQLDLKDNKMCHDFVYAYTSIGLVSLSILGLLLLTWFALRKFHYILSL